MSIQTVEPFEKLCGFLSLSLSGASASRVSSRPPPPARMFPYLHSNRNQMIHVLEFACLRLGVICRNKIFSSLTWVLKMDIQQLGLVVFGLNIDNWTALPLSPSLLLSSMKQWNKSCFGRKRNSVTFLQPTNQSPTHLPIHHPFTSHTIPSQPTPRHSDYSTSQSKKKVLLHSHTHTINTRHRTLVPMCVASFQTISRSSEVISVHESSSS